MGYKTILVHCDATEGAAGRLKVAADLARRFAAHLVGLHVRQQFQAPMFTDAAMAMDVLYATYDETVRTEEAAASKAFRQVVDGSGISSEWRVANGLADDALVENGRFADLVVLSQYEPGGPPTAAPSGLVEQVAMTTERPTLVVPYIGATKLPGDNVMLCWNGSREAVRAATAALPLLKVATTVTLLMIDPEKPADGKEPGADIAQWLARHGVKVVLQRDSAESSDVGSVILSRAADRQVDLIVMGIYGHSRMREMVMGGASRTLLATMTVPVLVAH